MSRGIGPRRAACRLHMNDTFLRLEGPDGLDERIDVSADGEGFREALRILAARCEGPVVAVLPAAIFAIIEPEGNWRAALVRRFGTRRLAVATGSREGSEYLVGVPREVLRDCAGLLVGAGFTLAAVEPASTLLPGGREHVFPVARAKPPSRLRALPIVPVLLRSLASGWRGAAVPAATAVLVAAFGFGALGFQDGEKPAPAEVTTEAGPEAAEWLGTVPPAEVRRAAHPLVDLAVPEVAAPLAAPDEPRPRDRLALFVPDPPRKRAPAPLPRVAVKRPAVVLASRNVPPEVREAALLAAASPAAEVKSYPRVAVLGPVPRPAALAPPPLVAGPRPLARPSVTTPVPLPEEAAGSASARPLPRPADGDDAAQLAAAITAALEVAAADPSTSAAPVMRPESRRVTPPITVRPGDPALAEPPMPVVAVAPSSAQQQAARVQSQTSARSFVPQATRGSGEVTLIGVFGTSSRRHALVLLPNGAVQRVRAGETVNGVEIATVGDDSVRVRVNGRDGVLRLPGQSNF